MTPTHKFTWPPRRQRHFKQDAEHNVRRKFRVCEQNKPEPLGPTVLEKDGQLFNIAASPSNFAVKDSFFPVCSEDSSQAPLIDYAQPPSILNIQGHS